MANVLITSAGRRVELVQAFQQEARRMPGAIKIIAADRNPELSSACHIADESFALPAMTDLGYADALLSECLSRGINLVIPQIDTGLAMLADNRSRFAEQGIHLAVSCSALIAECRDKRRTGELFARYGITYPEIYQPSSLTFPCFAKPYDGSSSIGVKALYSADELTEEMLNDESLMFMQLIDKNYCEYTVDAYYDRGGVLRCMVPRKRIETRAGEVSKGLTKKNFVYDVLSEKLARIEGARGCLTIQVFVNEIEQRIVGLEINPRFGGGYPLTYAAGANFPGWLLQEYLFDNDVQWQDEWQSNLLMLRYDAKVLVHDYI